MIIIVSGWSNWRLFNSGKSYKKEIQEFQDLIDNNNVKIDSLEQIKIQLDIEIDSINVVIDSLKTIDRNYNNQYNNTNTEYNETVTFINDASTTELDSFFTNNISKMDSL